jgi:hypothetical protein
MIPSPVDQLGEGTGGDRPRVGAKAPAQETGGGAVKRCPARAHGQGLKPEAPR